ncbi:MAG TPA: aminopeptidase P family N-terminal domain-containing protein, partial [Tissierellaceae bacterium]
MNTNEKINSLRKLMEDNKIDAYIIPSADPHQSEYLPEHYKSRAWLSGFTGSQGLVVVTKDKAILWTDGRYFTQAEDEIKDSEIELYKMGIPGYPTYIEWLSQTLVEGNILGFDGKLMPRSDVEEINSL